MRVLVTGASGFVGRQVVLRLLRERDTEVRAAGRRTAALPDAVMQLPAPDLSTDGDWRTALAGCDAVAHVAGRAHVLRDTAADSLAAFRAVNTAGTLRLARQAAAAGVRRFVFVSTVKVNGDRTSPGRPFTAHETPAPPDPYAVSKHEAELALRALECETGIEVVVVRPVLVYGPGVGANFRAMMSWIRRGIPLPLGALHNRRSLVAVHNLADLLTRCASHPAAAGATFMVSDGPPVSTTELLRRTAHHMGRPARLVPVPSRLLELGARLAGRGEMADRLCGSLEVDAAETRERLDWTPPRSFDDALRETVDDFLRAPRAATRTSTE
jgi:nucleoside-diphosphate-sugar epimerase